MWLPYLKPTPIVIAEDFFPPQDITTLDFTPEILHIDMGGTSQATAGFQDSDFFQKAIQMALRRTLSVNSHLSGFEV